MSPSRPRKTESNDPGYRVVRLYNARERTVLAGTLRECREYLGKAWAESATMEGGGTISGDGGPHNLGLVEYFYEGKPVRIYIGPGVSA